ncbi:hypothetical protein HKD37_08G021912 [Glycine soja]
MPLDPAAAATTTTSRPISPLPQPQMQQHHHHYPSQQQTLPIRAPNPHFVYPFAPKGVRAADQGPFPPPSMMHGGVPLDYFSHALHVARPPTHVPFSHAAAAAPAASPPVKKSAARSAVAHVNGGKDTNTREKSREDTYIVVRDRKASYRNPTILLYLKFTGLVGSVTHHLVFFHPWSYEEKRL